MAFSVDSPIGELLASPAAMEVLRKHVPAIADNPMLKTIEDLSFRQGAEMSRSKAPEGYEKLDLIDADLKSLG